MMILDIVFREKKFQYSQELREPRFILIKTFHEVLEEKNW